MQIILPRRSRKGAFTLAEVVMSFAIMAVVIGGIITGYYRVAQFATRASYQLAAQAQAIQLLEMVRAAGWNVSSMPPVDNTTNFPTTTINVMEMPISGTNVVYCTNYLTVSTLTLSPEQFKMIQVTTTYPWNGSVMSNTIVTYRAPDQ